MKMVLTFHRVWPAEQIEKNNLYKLKNTLISTAYFEQLIETLKAAHYTFVTCNELSQYPSSENVVAFTFDDGYYDNFQYAFPILLKHQVTATFFPVVDPCWNNTCLPLNIYYHCVQHYIPDITQQLAYITGPIKKKIILTPSHKQGVFIQHIFPEAPTRASDLFMSQEQIKTLHEAGMEIGSHTLTHNSFYSAFMTRTKCLYELKKTAEMIQACINAPVHTFCFPYGHYKNKHLKWVKLAGYQQAIVCNQTDVMSNTIPVFLRCNVTENLTIEALESYNFSMQHWKTPTLHTRLKQGIKKILHAFRWRY
ncbi:MAG: hypothetical protein FGM54_03880 [Chitinophagaceae bacterium]|nr:hypothetical protein [Chitinophagaceae bacterium]